jgi:hypothetical protein
MIRRTQDSSFLSPPSGSIVRSTGMFVVAMILLPISYRQGIGRSFTLGGVEFQGPLGENERI